MDSITLGDNATPVAGSYGAAGSAPSGPAAMDLKGGAQDEANNRRAGASGGTGADALTGNAFLNAALRYCALGLEVLPCHGITGGACTCGDSNCNSPGKHPLTTRGFHDASRDPHQVADWWTRWPWANVAIRPAEWGVVIDIDPRNGGEEGFERFVQDFGGHDPTIEVLTGGGGRHLYFLSDSVPSAKFSGVHCGIDVIGASGYVLAPPSAHVSGRTYQFEAETDLFAADFEPARLPSAWGQILVKGRGKPAGTARTHAAKSYRDLRVPVEGELKRIREALQHIDPDSPYGDWIRVLQALHSENVVGLFEVAVEWSARGEKFRDAEDVRMHWRSFNPDGGIGIATLYHMAARARKLPLDHANGSQSSRFNIMTVPQLRTMPAPKWIVRDVVPDSSLGVIYGSSGNGKTFVALDLACAIARGVEWHGHRVTQGSVLYVATEGRMVRRVEAYLHGHGVGESDLDNLLVLESSINLLADADVDALIAEIQALNIDNLTGVIVDTLNRSMPGGDENASQDMGRMIAAGAKIKSALGAFFIFVHHAGKDEARGARGHSSLKAATDFELHVRRSGQVREVVAEKVRDGEDGLSLFSFELKAVEVAIDDDGKSVTSCVVIERGASKSGNPIGILSPKAKEFLACIDAVLENTGGGVFSDESDVHAGAMSGQQGVLLSDVRKEFYALHEDRTENGDSSSFRRAKDELVEQGRIVVNARRVFVVPPSDGAGCNDGANGCTAPRTHLAGMVQ